MILVGKVKVNGKVIKELGYKASNDDDILVDNKRIKHEEKVVYLLNKPKNVISSTSDEKGRITVIDLIDSEYRLYPVGRLDYDSTGLLLLTNDGDLMNRIIHPKYEIEKVYEVTIDGLINKQLIDKIQSGVKIDNYISSPCKIKIISVNENKEKTKLLVSIYEGKNREIRKMFKKYNYNVLRLHRIKEANIELGDLKSGEYRKLKPFEIKQLKAYLDRVNN